MANAIYWDTSALLKLCAPEPDSSDYMRLLIQQPDDLAISFLHRVELYFALRGKESRCERALRAAKIQSVVTADMRMCAAANIAAIGVIEP